MTPGSRLRAALLVAGLVLLAGCGGGDDGGSPSTATTSAGKGPRLSTAFGSMGDLPGALKQTPWPANNGASLERRLHAIGLELLTAEGQELHIHQHLTLSVDGRSVTVPAQIGVDAGQRFISDLHTHDASGIVHVESPTRRDFSLGQFFAVWGLPLSADCIGSLCEEGSRQLRVWVDGTEVTADPTRIVLAEHQTIVIAYGTAAQMPDPVPASYDFAAHGV